MQVKQFCGKCEITEISLRIKFGLKKKREKLHNLLIKMKYSVDEFGEKIKTPSAPRFSHPFQMYQLLNLSLTKDPF